MTVYRVNDCEWYMANTLEEAIALAVADSGLPRDEATDKPRELSQEELDRLKFINPDGSRWSFARELQGRTEAGFKPGFFATTET